MMTPLLQHAFVGQSAVQSQANDPLAGQSPAPAGICRKLCAPPDQAQRTVERESNGGIRSDPHQGDLSLSGTGTLRWLDPKQPSALPIAATARFDVRTGIAMNGVPAPQRVNVRVFSHASLEAGVAVTLERPGAADVPCMVEQRLSRVNRYCLRVLQR